MPHVPVLTPIAVRSSALLVLAMLSALLTACGGAQDGATPPTAEQVVHLYNWSDYLAPDTLERFEQTTGIRVVYDVFDSSELLESKLLAGRSGYDVVVPTAPLMEAQIKAGVFRALDPAQLPNLANLDARLMQKVQTHDPGNRFGIPYLWGTTGIGFEHSAIVERMAAAPLDSWAILLDPEVVARFADCGVALLDSPLEVDDAVRIYLGLDPNGEDEAGLAAVEQALTRVRPYVRYFSNTQYINDLANGEICLAMGWTGDVLQARDRAREAGRREEIRYLIPREGATLFFDMMGIPADAPHPANAHRLLDFLMAPQTIADITNYTNFANANAAATPFVDEVIRTDPTIYPPDAQLDLLAADANESDAYRRRLVRMWTRLKARQ
ncbi:MAG: polyamine ABC transporter substrate-binding protein [Pseudomonadota bacterium]